MRAALSRSGNGPRRGFRRRLAGSVEARIGTRLDEHFYAWVRSAPMADVVRLARLLAPRRAGRVFPGWHHGIADKGLPLHRLAGWRYRSSTASPGRLVEYRFEIWQRCRAESDPWSLRMAWCLRRHLTIRLGTDLGRDLYVGGCFEPNELAALNRVLRAGDVFFDVGANEGVYTVFAAAKVGRGGRVIAVEPSEREVGWLRGNVQDNGLSNVVVVQRALADAEGEVDLNVAPEAHAGLNTIGNLLDVTLARAERVRACTLDTLVDELNAQRVDVIKADIEGAEDRLLQGAVATLRRHKPLLLLEFNPRSLAAQGSSAAAVAARLSGCGYDLYPISATSGLPVRHGPVTEGCNVFAMHPDRRFPGLER